MLLDLFKEFSYEVYYFISLILAPFLDADVVREGDKGVVVLVGGWFSPNAYSLVLKKRLEKAGFTVYFPGMGLRLGDIRGYARILEDYVSEKGLEEFSIVAHSMGGLIACEYMKNNEGKVRKVITTATPFKGTRIARLAFFSKAARQMTPNSGFLKGLVLPDNLKAIAVRHDQRVPVSSSIPKYCDSVVFSGFGHSKSLFSKEIFKEIRSSLLR